MNIKNLENHIRKISQNIILVYSDKQYENPLFDLISGMKKYSEYKKLYSAHENNFFKVGEELSTLLSSDFKKEILCLWLQKFDFRKVLEEEEYTTFSAILIILRDLRVMGVNKLSLISPEINEKISFEILHTPTSIIFSKDNIYRLFLHSGVYLDDDIMKHIENIVVEDNTCNMNNKINYQKEILEMNLNNKDSKKSIKHKI